MAQGTTRGSIAIIPSIDAIPIDGSANPVSSNGVFDALATKFELPALTNGSVLFSNGSTITQDNVNLFWNDFNNRLGIGTNVPTQTLDVNGTSRFTGLMTVGNIVGAANGNTIGSLSNPSAISFFSNQINYYSSYLARTGVVHDFSAGQSNNLTTGENSFSSFTNGFTPTSGTGVWSLMKLTTSINQTGGASGITRGLYINPTLTSAFDFRAIEVSNGGAYINTTNVQASAILQADSTTKGFLPPRMTNAQRIAIASPAIGLVVYCTDATEGLWENTATGWVNLTGDQNIFSTIAVAGQSDIVADTTSDTLTLVAGTNITITTNAATDEITINSSGGGGGVSDGDKGDIVVTGTGTIWTIDDNAVDYTKSYNGIQLAIIRNLQTSNIF
jgi:hypothetical protein